MRFFKQHPVVTELSAWVGCAAIWFGLLSFLEQCLRYFGFRLSVGWMLIVAFVVAPFVMWYLSAAMAHYYSTGSEAK